MTTAIPWQQAPTRQENLTEPEFQRQIIDMAANLGWVRHYHNLYAVGSDRGYPDLTLVHPRHGVVWLEVKGGTRCTIYRKQLDWIEDLWAAGQHAYIVKPKDYDLVQSVLRGEVPRPVDGRPSDLVADLLAYHDRSKAK